MKKLLGKTAAIMVVAIVTGIFITAESSAAGEKARDGRFIAYDNGTVLDTKTNLMWADKDNGRLIPWTYAQTYCKNYRGGGYTDWRMPTLDELKGLYDESKTYPSDCDEGTNVHLTKLILLRCGYVWSSETMGTNGAYYFIFYDGSDKWGHQTDINFNMRVLPVRSVKSDLGLPRPVGMESSSDIIEYKDGEDGVNRTRPGNHKPGESSPAQPEYKDGEDGTMRALPPK